MPYLCKGPTHVEKVKLIIQDWLSRNMEIYFFVKLKPCNSILGACTSGCAYMRGNRLFNFSQNTGCPQKNLKQKIRNVLALPFLPPKSKSFPSFETSNRSLFLWFAYYTKKVPRLHSIISVLVYALRNTYTIENFQSHGYLKRVIFFEHYTKYRTLLVEMNED